MSGEWVTGRLPEPYRVERPKPTAVWRVEHAGNWPDNFTVRRYVDAAYGETVSIEKTTGMEATLRMSPDTAKELLAALLAAATWKDRGSNDEGQPRTEDDH